MSPLLMVSIAIIVGLIIGVVIGILFSRLLSAEKLQSLSAEATRLQQALETHQGLPEKLAASSARLETMQQQLQENRQTQAQLDQEKQSLNDSLRQRDKTIAEMETRLKAEQTQLERQTLFIEQQMKALQLQFEQQATRILEEKSQKFTEQNRVGIDSVLSPLREQLKDFREKVESAYNNEARERFALKTELEKLGAMNQQISDDANNLTKALKGDKKLQGNWGEVILSRVLTESGLREGHEYQTQFATKDEEGNRRLPDVIIHLPENRDIVVDSKVSLVDYERYCSTEEVSEREQALKQHTLAIRQHINALSDKKYEDLDGIKTLDFVFLFMPIEAAFMLAVEHDRELFSHAFSKRIIIVSPTTLLATLRTVESIWRYERQNKNAEEIALEAGRLYDKLCTLLDHLSEVGKLLDKSKESYEKTVSSLKGNGGLVSKVEKLQKLGAKTKKSLPLDKFDVDHSEELTDNLPTSEDN
jgi:DNA recombination protein RmuC